MHSVCHRGEVSSLTMLRSIFLMVNYCVIMMAVLLHFSLGSRGLLVRASGLEPMGCRFQVGSLTTGPRLPLCKVPSVCFTSVCAVCFTNSRLGRMERPNFSCVQNTWPTRLILFSILYFFPIWFAILFSFLTGAKCRKGHVSVYVILIA